MPQKWGFKVGLVLSYWVFIFVLLNIALHGTGSYDLAAYLALILLTLPLGILVPAYIMHSSDSLITGVVILSALVNNCIVYGLVALARKRKP